MWDVLRIRRRSINLNLFTFTECEKQGDRHPPHVHAVWVRMVIADTPAL